MRLQRIRIKADPARRDDGGQRRLLGFGSDFSRALNQRGIDLERGDGRVLERCDARFAPCQGYLARDGIKYLRRLDGIRLEIGAEAGAASEGGQAQGALYKV